MANTINLYETRTMMQAIERMAPVNTFFRDTFFSRVETNPTEKIDVDFKKGKRKMAPFVAPRTGGITMDRQGYATRSYTPPRIAPQRLLTKDDISKRMAGEAVYSRMTPEERSAQLLGKDLSELDELITRREEWMCRQVIINGKVVMRGLIDDTSDNYVEQEVDYGLTNKETLAGDDKWDADTSDKYGYLKEKRLEIIQGVGRAPNIVILASDVVDLFIDDAKIQKYLDNRGYQMGLIQPKIINDAVTFIGKLPGLGMEIYSYDDWFIDDDGEEQPMMPEKHIIIGRIGMARRLYGAITQMDNNEEFITYEGTRVPRVWADKNNEVKIVKVSSRPLPAPEDVDDWYVSQVY